MILVLLTFALGAGALMTGNRINEKQTSRLVTLETELAKSKERAAIAERQLLEIKEGLKPRVVSLENVARLREALAAITDKVPLRVGIAGGDAEAHAFGGQLIEALTAAGWKVDGLTLMDVTGTGMALVVAKSVPPYVKRLFAAFGAGGVHLPIQEDPNLPKSLVGPENPVMLLVLRPLIRIE